MPAGFGFQIDSLRQNSPGHPAKFFIDKKGEPFAKVHIVF
jgi:hypothetical protein